MMIFDGYAFAREREQKLKTSVDALKQFGKQLAIASILFTEDSGSQLYTQLKKEAAERVGIQYTVFPFSIKDDVSAIQACIHELNRGEATTGIIIQKPSKKRWVAVSDLAEADFSPWWMSLVKEIAPDKDVDGLHPETLAAIERGTWRDEHKVMPATAKAVLAILNSRQLAADATYIILGKSDILGKPLFFELRNQGKPVEMFGRSEVEARRASGQFFLDADVLITATGQAGLITGSMIKTGSTLLDVGEPRPDVDASTLEDKPAFLTPVPGGVGPVTVVSLLENCVELARG